MNAWVVGALLLYVVILMAWSRLWSRGTGNRAFFIGDRASNWGLVAFGMIGASVSGVSFISVPGWVAQTHMTYLQMCLGFVVGYIVVAFVLLPLFWKMGVASIYTFLGERLGNRARQTGALFFVLSKLTGASARLYVVVIVLHQFVFIHLGLPFMASAATTLLLIWIYTRRSGLKALVHTDVLQTFFMLCALFALLYAAARVLNYGFKDLCLVATQHEWSEIIRWDGTQSFPRQFLSGIFIVIVMTGLDQDMMQKNLSCRSLRDAQKDMCTYGLGFLPVNFLLLLLGILLYTIASVQGFDSIVAGDRLLPALVESGRLGDWVIIPFILGIAAAAFSSADSALTSLTTTICIDFLSMNPDAADCPSDIRRRRMVHLGVAIGCLVCTWLFYLINSASAIHAIYVLASYTYGPLLGLFLFAIFTRRQLRQRLVPLVCIMAPVACWLLDRVAPVLWNYTFGYELLMLNGALTFLGLWACSIGRRTA